MSETTTQELLIVTGMSGAGRSTVANALEDLGWYVVDNLPPQMLKPLVELAEHASSRIPKIAAVFDIRGRNFFDPLQEILANLGEGTQVRMVFLEATDATLIKRFEQVRRPHPFQEKGTISDGIIAERDKLKELRAISDVVIDTTNLNVHQLSKLIIEEFGEFSDNKISLTIMSFGFKYGAPTDADMIVDMRFLPNPFWIPDLRAHNGTDVEVSDYVLDQPLARQFLTSYIDALKPVLEGYRNENKRHVTLAVGCTGGKHRSVAVSEYLAKTLNAEDTINVSLKHRDLGRE